MYDDNDKGLISSYLSKIQPDKDEVPSDNALALSDTKNLTAHNEQYTELLKAYVTYYKNTSVNKQKHKGTIFLIAKWMLILAPSSTAVFVIFSLCCLLYGKLTLLEILPGIITFLSSLIGTFIVIPQIITDYLFNKDEEQNLANIISKIQEYDRDVRNTLK